MTRAGRTDSIGAAEDRQLRERLGAAEDRQLMERLAAAKDRRLRERLSRMLPDLPPADSADAEVEKRLSDAKAAFVRGFRNALFASADALSKLGDDESPDLRGFALEGAGMATVLLDELAETHLQSLSNELADGHLKPRLDERANTQLTALLLKGRSDAEHVLIAIGAGWGGARLHKSADWLPRGISDHYARDVADGCGFHQGFFHARRFSDRGFPHVNDAFDVGLGRSLWFVHGGRLELIGSDIEQMPVDRQASLWQGVGTACAFTGCVRRQTARGAQTTLEPERLNIPKVFSDHFLNGIDRGTHLLRELAQPKKEATL